MLNNPIFLEQMVKERHLNLQKEAEMIRLSKVTRPEKERVQYWGVIQFANLLISLGEYLKRKYSSPLCLPKDTGTC